MHASIDATSSVATKQASGRAICAERVTLCNVVAFFEGAINGEETRTGMLAQTSGGVA